MHALSIVENRCLLAISDGTAPVAVVHKSISNAGFSEKCLEAVARPEVKVDSRSGTSVYGLAYNDFLSGA